MLQKNWHRVTASPQRFEVKAEALKFVGKSNILKEKVLSHNAKSMWTPDPNFVVFPR